MSRRVLFILFLRDCQFNRLDNMNFIAYINQDIYVNLRQIFHENI